MRLTAFQSGKGDCLLLETEDRNHRILIDGGMDDAYTAHVAPALAKLGTANRHIDVVYVSHIDEDHISGVLRLLDDEAAWRVHQHQLPTNPNHPVPAVGRPPQIGAIFHNAFHDQIVENRGRIEDMLAATTRILSGSEDPWVMGVAQARRDLVASIPQALRVSQRIKPNQLNIPLNPNFAGKLMLVKGDMPALPVGSITLRLLGPFSEDMTKLRKDWNRWLDEHEKTVRDLRSRALRDIQDLTASEVDRTLGPLLAEAARLGDLELATAKKLGRRSEVTTPNLASLMFLAEEDGRSILLTGDGHADDILRGLDHHNALEVDGTRHVNVLKVQHHGSEHNIDKDFCDAITADHYVWCGNGQHENPDLEVLQLVHDRRMATDNRRFKFWFNSTSTHSDDPGGRAHMHTVETLVAKLAENSRARLTAKFINGPSLRII